MSFRRRLIVFGYPLLELVTFIALVSWFGWGWALLITFIGIPIGFFVFRSAGREALRGARRNSVPSRAITFRMLSGLLFMVPGVWTDVAALLLFLPAVQARLAAPFRNFSTSSGGMNWRIRTWGNRMDTVEGVVIHENDDPVDPRSIEWDD